MKLCAVCVTNYYLKTAKHSFNRLLSLPRASCIQLYYTLASHHTATLFVSCVCSSLLNKDGSYTAVNESNGQLIFSEIMELKTENLFLYSFLKNQQAQKLAA